LIALRDEMAVRRQREALLASVGVAGEVMDRVDVEFKRGQSDMNGIFDELEEKLEWALAGLGLSEDQERGVWGIVHPLVGRARGLYDQGLRLDDQLDQALASLRASLTMGQPGDAPRQ
jgi:hypothetical protein